MDGVLPKQEQKASYNWPLLSQFVALFAILAVLFQSSLAPLFARWIKWDQELSHGIPTLLAALYLIWRTQNLPYKQNSKSIRNVLVGAIALLSLLWCLFIVANINILANVVLFACIPLLIAASYSLTTSYFLLPIVSALLFTMPFFGQLNDLLLWMSATAVGFLVQLFGITALLDGQNIFIPSGHIFIADGCSGLRYFTISILLGYLLSILNNYSLKGTIIALTVATGLGLVTNWLRIFLLVVIGDLTEMKSSLMQDHEFFGWVLFTCVMFPAIFFAPIAPKKEIPATSPTQFKPVAALIALTIGPILLALAPNQPHSLPQFSLHSLQTQLAPLTSNTPIDLKVPTSIDNDAAQIEINGINLYVQLSEYKPNNLKEKIIPYFENLYNKEEWRIIAQPSSQLDSLNFQTLILAQGYKQEYILLTYRFEVGPYNTNNYQIAKVLQIPATFAGKRYSNFFIMQSKCKDESCSKELNASAHLALIWDKNTKALR